MKRPAEALARIPMPVTPPLVPGGTACAGGGQEGPAAAAAQRRRTPPHTGIPTRQRGKRDFSRPRDRLRDTKVLPGAGWSGRSDVVAPRSSPGGKTVPEGEARWRN
mmetsp:Transcript_27649/g.65660  ORF Transcript_27649/g.65660 Transcript_27649/m.65660 type:complete len:106 (-) Transcript_27649:292-609(-)